MRFPRRYRDFAIYGVSLYIGKSLYIKKVPNFQPQIWQKAISSLENDFKWLKIGIHDLEWVVY